MEADARSSRRRCGTLGVNNRTNAIEQRLKGNVAMGISITVLMAIDAQIRDFRAQPIRLENLLNRTIPYDREDGCYLVPLLCLRR